jgi:hypothetical protein
MVLELLTTIKAWMIFNQGQVTPKYKNKNKNRSSKRRLALPSRNSIAKYFTIMKKLVRSKKLNKLMFSMTYIK